MTHSRRQFLAAAGSAAFAQPAQRPLNLIYIIADQHSGVALPAAGDPYVHVPNLERLARSGVTFLDTCTAGMTCAPSRASMDTGLHAGSHGVRTNGIALPSDVPSIHRELERAGYVVSQDPKHYDEWARSLGYEDMDGKIIGSRSMARLLPTPYRFATGRAGLAPEHTYDAYVTHSALRFLEQNRHRPFCCWVRLHGSHDPYVVPRPYDTMYDPAKLAMPAYRTGEYDEKPPRQKRAWRDSQHADQLSDDQIKTILAHYYGMVSHTDFLVGKLLDRVTELGLLDNTVIVYTADHGDCMGRHRMFTKGFCFYEPAIRIPFIVRAPGAFPHGKRVSQPASGVDILPTLLELMGLPALPAVHGQSLVSHWRGDLPVIDRPVYAGQGFEGRDRAVMLRTRRWKLARYDDGGWELYDREKDPDELRSVYADPAYAATFQRLKADLEAWDRAHTHREPVGNPEAADAFRKWKARN
jgi:arylsulfatase A-like enzyme